MSVLVAEPVDVAAEPVERRVEVELSIDGVAISLSFVNAPLECIRDIVGTAVETALSKSHHDIREHAEEPPKPPEPM